MTEKPQFFDAGKPSMEILGNIGDIFRRNFGYQWSLHHAEQLRPYPVNTYASNIETSFTSKQKQSTNPFTKDKEKSWRRKRSSVYSSIISVFYRNINC